MGELQRMTPLTEKFVRDTVAGYDLLSARVKEVAIEVAIEVAKIQDTCQPG